MELKIPDRRKYPRMRANFDVIYGHQGQTSIGRAIDIGLGGLCLIGDLRFPEGAEIQITLRAPGKNEDLLKTTAIVRYSEQNNLRLQFVEVRSPQEIERLLKLQ